MSKWETGMRKKEIREEKKEKKQSYWQSLSFLGHTKRQCLNDMTIMYIKLYKWMLYLRSDKNNYATITMYITLLL